MAETRFSLQTSWLARVLILALIAVNLLLVRQNFNIRRQLADRGSAVDATPKALRTGEVVPSVVGSDFNGQPYELKYKKDERKHLVLFFSPSCVYCVRQAPLWRAVLDKIDPTRFDVLGVVSDKEDKKAVFGHAEELGYFKTKTPLPIVFVSNESLERYKLMATPTTLLISSDGSVEHVWTGKWDDTKANEVAVALQ